MKQAILWQRIFWRRCCQRARRIDEGKLLGLLLAGMMLTTAATVGTSQSPPATDAPAVPANPFGAGGLPAPAQAGSPGPASAGASSERADRADAAGELLGFSHTNGSGTQTITLVHTGKSWMAVYHIDRSGQIRLVSSRPIEADFTLQLNATSPLPEEIRQLGGQGR